MGHRPQLRDRFLAFLARLLARAFFPSVQVEGAPPTDGQVILAAGHLDGFVDPVLLLAHLGHLPRFLPSTAPACPSTARSASSPPGSRRLDPLLEAAFDGDRSGVGPGVAVFVAVPLFGFLALVFVERSLALARDRLVWRVLLDRRGQLAVLRTRRADVVAVTLATAEGEPERSA